MCIRGGVAQDQDHEIQTHCFFSFFAASCPKNTTEVMNIE